MRNIAPLGDDRMLACCVYCGAAADTRDHLPARVLLDEPYPENLPVVRCCEACNHSFSMDEEYLAALLDCVAVGDSSHGHPHREKVRAILRRHPALASALDEARACGPDGAVTFRVDLQRVEHVVIKLAKGHAAHELHDIRLGGPSQVAITPLVGLTDAQRIAFETPPVPSAFPEVGSRAMLGEFEHGMPSPHWIDVQRGRYRFLACPGVPLLIRMILGEYLACEVAWSDVPSSCC